MFEEGPNLKRGNMGLVNELEILYNTLR